MNATAPRPAAPTASALATGPATATPPWPSAAQAWYLIAVLMVAYVLSFIDRVVLALLVGPIRAEFGVNDTAMSILYGFGFAIFYTTLGVPIARLADRLNRRNIIAAGIFFWSLMTAACGVTRNYWELLLARIGVGVGEAALSPAAYSMIADSFPERTLGRALSVYTIGLPMGVGLALIIGGAVVQFAATAPPVVLPVFGQLSAWHLVFIVVGLPGILVAAWMMTLPEPVRRRLAPPTQAAPPVGGGHYLPLAAGVALLVAALAGVEIPGGTGFAEAFQLPPGTGGIGIAVVVLGFGALYAWLIVPPLARFLHEGRDHLRTRWGVYAATILGFSVLGMVLNGVQIWGVQWFVRVHEFPLSRAGLWIGLVIAVFGTLGIVAGGWITDWLRARGHVDAALRTGLIASIGLVPFVATATLMDDPRVAIALLVPVGLFTSFAFGAGAAAITVLTPNHLRAQASAIYLLFVNLIGIGLAPLLVALLNDYVYADDLAVGRSLAIVSTCAALLAAALFAWGLPRFRRAIAG
ncbi:MAG: MFS transporter [Pseudomonadota bacterium]